MFFLFNYIFILFGLINFLLVFKEYRGFLKVKNIVFLKDLCNLYKENKILIYCFLFFLFSLSGLPPFLGFFIKLFIIKFLDF